jgi:hypothetical protein
MSGCGRDIPFGGYAVRSRGETIRSHGDGSLPSPHPTPAGTSPRPSSLRPESHSYQAEFAAVVRRELRSGSRTARRSRSRIHYLAVARHGGDEKVSREFQIGCMIRPMMRWDWIVLSVVLALVLLRFGVVWTLQGLNLWRGSFMSGSPRWLTIGVILDVVAILLLVQAGRLLRQQVKS